MRVRNPLTGVDLQITDTGSALSRLDAESLQVIREIVKEEVNKQSLLLIEGMRGHSLTLIDHTAKLADIIIARINKDEPTSTKETKEASDS